MYVARWENGDYSIVCPPTVAEIIGKSPRFWENGHLQTAWNLVAGLDYRGGDMTALVVAIGCLCQELAKITEEDLDRPEPGRPGALGGVR